MSSKSKKKTKGAFGRPWGKHDQDMRTTIEYAVYGNPFSRHREVVPVAQDPIGDAIEAIKETPDTWYATTINDCEPDETN